MKKNIVSLFFYFLTFFIFITFLILIFKPMFNDSFYSGHIKKEKESVFVDIINPQSYIIKSDMAIKDESEKSKIYKNMIKTYSGDVYVYNNEDLVCNYLKVDDKFINGPKEKGHYKEIKKVNGEWIISIYDITTWHTYSRYGKEKSYLVFYRTKECNNIYKVKNIIH